MLLKRYARGCRRQPPEAQPADQAWLSLTVMIICDMAKKPRSPPAPPAKRRRGRPPKPGGPTPQVEIQRAYRARLAAAGKVVRLVDAAPGNAATGSPALPSIPDFDPATQLVCDREMFEGMRDQLHNALMKLEVRQREVARLETRNAYLEGELKLQERHYTNTLKEVITLKQQLAKKKPAKRR